MNTERLKYLSALVSVLGSIVAALTVALVFSEKEIGDTLEAEFGFVVASLAAAMMAAFSAFAMLAILRLKRAERARRIFLIYAREDLETAKEIAELLRENDLEPWLDVEKITAGQIWSDEIQSALNKSAMALVLLSNNLQNSTYAAKELKAAISSLESSDRMSSPLIPVRIDESEIPPSIAHIQTVDYKQKGAKEFLVRSLKVAMDKIIGVGTVSA